MTLCQFYVTSITVFEAFNPKIISNVCHQSVILEHTELAAQHPVVSTVLDQTTSVTMSTDIASLGVIAGFTDWNVRIPAAVTVPGMTIPVRETLEPVLGDVILATREPSVIKVSILARTRMRKSSVWSGYTNVLNNKRVLYRAFRNDKR